MNRISGIIAALAIAAATPAAAQPAPAVHTDSGAAAKSEPILRRVIGELQAGKPDYSQMADRLAANVRNNLAASNNVFAALGPMQTVSFTGTDPDGADIYEVTFAHGRTQWHLIVGEDQRLTSLLLLPPRTLD